jgi:hypothetical protein
MPVLMRTLILDLEAWRIRRASVSLDLPNVTKSRTALILVAAAAALQLLYNYPRMPETLASHFDGAGQPNGVQSREGFFGLSVGILVLTVIVMGGLGVLLRRLPSHWFNLPHRDYWLSPERREETIGYIGGQMEWFGAASLLLMLVILEMAFEANLSPAPRLEPGPVWAVLGVYLVFTTVWIVRFIRHFRRPATTS